MANVAKVIEIVGSSSESWAAAAAVAVETAAETINGITGIQVSGMTANVKDGQITDYKATVKIAFGVGGD